VAAYLAQCRRQQVGIDPHPELPPPVASTWMVTFAGLLESNDKVERDARNVLKFVALTESEGILRC